MAAHMTSTSQPMYSTYSSRQAKHALIWGLLNVPTEIYYICHDNKQNQPLFAKIRLLPRQPHIWLHVNSITLLLLLLLLIYHFLLFIVTWLSTKGNSSINKPSDFALLDTHRRPARYLSRTSCTKDSDQTSPCFHRKKGLQNARRNLTLLERQVVAFYKSGGGRLLWCCIMFSSTVALCRSFSLPILQQLFCRSTHLKNRDKRSAC
jgi:hypothetical protein